MALNAYLSIVAQKQGPIRGSVTQRGREGKSMVIGAMHQIVCPRDPASGMPTGKRAHKPFIVLKELDRATPLFPTPVSVPTTNRPASTLNPCTPHLRTAHNLA